MASNVLKMSNNNTKLTLFNAFATKLVGGAGENILIEIAMCLPVQDIAHLFETSFMQQLHKVWKHGDQDPLYHIKMLFAGMKRVYRVHTKFNRLSLAFAPPSSWKHMEKRLLKQFPLLFACRVGSDEDVRVLVNEHDKYITNVYQLLQLNDVHYLTDMINVRVNIDDLIYITKNALHECIYLYNEQRNVENCGKRLAILRMLSNFTQHNDTAFSFPISYLVPHVLSGGGSTNNPNGWMVWRPLTCVQSWDDYYEQAIRYQIDRSFILVYFPCYHWGMDWFYQRELYEYGVLMGEHEEGEYNRHLEGGVYEKDGKKCTDEEYDAYLQQKKEITAEFGKRVFDAAKSMNIINHVFELKLEGNTQQATIFDLHEIAFRKFREWFGVGSGDYVDLEYLKPSYDEAVEIKLKQLREEYGAKQYREL